MATMTKSGEIAFLTDLLRQRLDELAAEVLGAGPERAAEGKQLLAAACVPLEGLVKGLGLLEQRLDRVAERREAAAQAWTELEGLFRARGAAS